MQRNCSRRYFIRLRAILAIVVTLASNGPPSYGEYQLEPNPFGESVELLVFVFNR